MKADYKNWMPKGMLVFLFCMAAACLAVSVIFGAAGVLTEGALRIVLGAVFGAGFVFFAVFAVLCSNMYLAFSYNGRRRVSERIINRLAAYVTLPAGGKGLDVGCGSGALTIACAKNNPHAEMVGVDRWGKEYASFSRELCERNSVAEGVSNVRFMRGDAVRLDFPDESFDAVTSNYVYHNIKGKDRQELLLETLRVLKKGGTFAIHDCMPRSLYGDIAFFAQKLKDMGYERVELIGTTNGRFLSKRESRLYMLGDSTLLVGKK